MINMIQNAKDQVATLAMNAYQAAVADGTLPQAEVKTAPVEIPKDTANGDFTTTFALACSKALRQPPRNIAQALLVMAYVMQSGTTGMMSLIAGDIAALAGTLYPAAAVLIGSLGSFVTGTGLGSNIMFAGMHTEAAAALGMNPITVFAGQNAGASLGNLICPNNTVAACATVGEVGNESKVMKRTLAAFAIVLCVYMVLCMVYTLVLFPNFGM